MDENRSEQRSVGLMIMTTRIIVFALFCGVAAFGAFVVVNGPGELPDNRQPLLTYLSVPFAFTCAMLSVIVPRVIARLQCNAVAAGRFTAAGTSGNSIDTTTDRGKLALIYQTTTIIAGALLEAPIFFALWAYWQEGQLLALVIAIVLTVLLLMFFPVQGYVDRWIDNRLREIHDQRESGLQR